MRYISLFSGIEAASVAWEPLGFTPIAFSEIDPFCSQLLKVRYPDVPNLGDISAIDWRPYHGEVDLIVGGSPCQAFSIAGPRTGLLDERSALMLEYVRAIREVKPTWAVWENVCGAMSQDRGRAFATLQRELENCGYSLAWRVLDAQFFGVAQRRRRIFLVGHSDFRCAAAVLFERESLLGNNLSSREARKKLAAAAKARFRDPRRCSGLDEYRTIPARTDKNLELYENHGKDARVKGPMDTCPTITALYGTGGNNTPLIHEQPSPPTAYALVGNIIGRGLESGGNGNGFSEELCYTLTAMDHHAVCAPSSQAPYGSPDQSCTAQETSTGRPLSVRRLMPIECERLQGFPDNWTRIEWNGKPEEQCPDSRRYKAIGNSMAVPVMSWLGRNIQLVDSLSKHESIRVQIH